LHQALAILAHRPPTGTPALIPGPPCLFSDRCRRPCNTISFQTTPTRPWLPSASWHKRLSGNGIASEVDVASLHQARTETLCEAVSAVRPRHQGIL
jgi:hypothetical protein